MVPVIADFFNIKRGLATGDNRYFILSEEEITKRALPRDCFRPILPSPRYLRGDEVLADAAGMPLIERKLFLLDTRLSEAEVVREHPTLAEYLNAGRLMGLADRYLCKHRSPWYAQEHRPAPPIICTYMGRGESLRPFRFIMNESKATVANVYLAMYPKPTLARALASDKGLLKRVWLALSAITPDRLLGEGRVYGGGLHKLEPKELANVPVPEIAEMLPPEGRQAELDFSEPRTSERGGVRGPGEGGALSA